MDYGLQMYSVRDITDKDLLGALEKVAGMGYKLIEFAGFFGYKAEDVKAKMDELGVKASGTHTGLNALVEDFEGTVAYHKAIGCANLIIPGHDLSSKEKIDDFVEKVNYYQPLLAKEGIKLGYHNHSHEFIPNADGSVIYDELTARTAMNLEIDTFWAFNAGKDPVAMMEAFKDRLFFIHIKDGFKGGEGKPLGQGEAPVKAVYRKAKEMGIPMVVESETLTPDGVTEAKACIDFLKAQE